VPVLSVLLVFSVVVVSLSAFLASAVSVPLSPEVSATAVPTSPKLRTTIVTATSAANERATFLHDEFMGTYFPPAP
jgi:hypothetical protein